MDFSPVWISLKTTVCSSVITFVLGIVAAWAVMFIKSKKWKAAVDGFLTIPLVLPPTVAGFFLLWLFGARRPIGSFVEEAFGFRIAFFLGRYCACGSGRIVSSHVPFCESRI